MRLYLGEEKGRSEGRAKQNEIRGCKEEKRRKGEDARWVGWGSVREGVVRGEKRGILTSRCLVPLSSCGYYA